MKAFHIVTMSTYGTGLSGGDRIWIELAKRIRGKYPVSVYLWEEGKVIAERGKLRDVNFVLWSAKEWSKFGFFINYFARILIGIFKAFTLKLENAPQTIVYSASEFWQDSLPSFILKLRYPKIKWAAAWYQTAPNPLIGYSQEEETTRYRFKAFLYWLVQTPVKPIIKKFADFIFVTSEPDQKHFPSQNKKGHILIVKGGVDLKETQFFAEKFKNLSKIYDGVFQGRLHPQKGVLELVDIWKMVVNKKPDAKLAMIGDGPLMKNVKLKMKNEKLENNIKLLGWVFDGSKKYRIFSQSRIVVHPAFYDSGGMAAAEAMAFGLPGISFDLDALKTYYPSGMVKVPIGDIDKFSEQIIHLLTDQKFYKHLRKQALALIHKNWSWDFLTERVLNKLNNHE